MTTEERDRIKALERENRELRPANEILCKASAYFAQAEVVRPLKRYSPSMRISALFTASSRSAEFCQSRRQRFTTTWCVVPILPRHQPDTNGMQSCDRRSKGAGMKTIRSTGSARRGTR